MAPDDNFGLYACDVLMPDVPLPGKFIFFSNTFLLTLLFHIYPHLFQPRHPLILTVSAPLLFFLPHPSLQYPELLPQCDRASEAVRIRAWRVSVGLPVRLAAVSGCACATGATEAACAGCIPLVWAAEDHCSHTLNGRPPFPHAYSAPPLFCACPRAALGECLLPLQRLHTHTHRAPLRLLV